MTEEEYKIMSIIKYTIKNTSNDIIYWLCFDDNGDPQIFGRVGPGQTFDTKYEDVEQYLDYDVFRDRLVELNIVPEGADIEPVIQ